MKQWKVRKKLDQVNPSKEEQSSLEDLLESQSSNNNLLVSKLKKEVKAYSSAGEKIGGKNPWIRPTGNNKGSTVVAILSLSVDSLFASSFFSCIRIPVMKMKAVRWAERDSDGARSRCFDDREEMKQEPREEGSQK